MPGTDRFGVKDLGSLWYSGAVSFLRAPIVTPSAVEAGEIAVVGMPLDQFVATTGRTGMRFGPRALRVASLELATYFGVIQDDGILDVSSGALTSWPERMPLVDTGDVPIIPNQISSQIEVAVEHVREASLRSSVTVTLGGDHYVAYLACRGVLEARRKAMGDSFRLGYLHVDSHTDFVDEHLYLGKHHRGSPARRISELDNVSRMAWFGVNTSIQPNELHLMKERGFRVFAPSYIRRRGIESALKEAIDFVSDAASGIYVSLDIDTVNASDAPGTGAPIFEGLSAAEFLRIARALSASDSLVGLDLCEVDPEFDPTGRTQLLGATALVEVLRRRLFTISRPMRPEQIENVVLT